MKCVQYTPRTLNCTRNQTEDALFLGKNPRKAVTCNCIYIKSRALYIASISTPRVADALKQCPKLVVTCNCVYEDTDAFVAPKTPQFGKTAALKTVPFIAIKRRKFYKRPQKTAPFSAVSYTISGGVSLQKQCPLLSLGNNDEQ